MFNKLDVSVIILAHTVNPKLLYAIDSAQWANEVLVIWTTKEQAPKLEHALVVTSSHVHLHFAAIRNEALQHAKNDWVFYLDSDEVFTNGSAEKMSAILNKQISGITVLRRDIFLGKELHWGEVGNMRLLRAFRKSDGHFVRAVHEVAEVNGEVLDSDISIVHAAHDSIGSFITKIITYATLDAGLRGSQHVSIVSLFAWPTGKFFVNYFWKLGILDGWRGLVYASVMSVHSFTVRALLYEKNHA